MVVYESRNREKTWTEAADVGRQTTNGVVTKSVNFNYEGYQQMADEVHIWPLPERMRLSDVGGPMISVKYTSHRDMAPLHLSNLNGSKRWDGPVVADTLDAHPSSFIGRTRWVPFVPTTDDVLFSLGGTAISRVAPTNPHASAAQALGELRRDGIPAIPGFEAFKNRGRPDRDINTAGSEYLNWDFGIKPLVSDVRKILRSARDSERVLSQYRRDAGRPVRRSYAFPEEFTTETTYLSDGYPVGPSDLSLWRVPKGKRTLTQTSRTTTGFSGAFTYCSGGVDDSLTSVRRTLREANHLLGVGITPETLWDLTPWTWATDWAINLGDTISNVSAMVSDGMVVVYGYLTRVTVAERTYTNVGAISQNGIAPSLSTTYTTTCIQRVSASPFGFGFVMDLISGHQIAILSALGMSNREGRRRAL